MSRKRLVVYASCLLAGCIFCWRFPLFHLRPMGKTSAQTESPDTSLHDLAPADPISYVQDFWVGPLRTGDGGTEITQLWDAFESDSLTAQSKYGRQAGLGGAWYFCVRGQGTVESVQRNRAILIVANRSKRACLELGLVVDNTVREAIGVKASEFANSQDFNAISSELNRRVEQEIIEPSRTLFKAGEVVSFVGCAQVGDRSALDPLCLIPIRLEVLVNESNRSDSNDSSDEETSQ